MAPRADKQRVRRIPAASKVKNEYQGAVDLIEQWSPIIQERMGLGHFEIENHYLDASSSLILGSRPKNRPGIVRCGFGAAGESSYTAFVETRWNYQMADVYYMLPSVIQWEPERLKRVVVHEHSHVLMAAEQYLLEVKLAEVAADEEMTANDFDALAMLYYERMEMSTENVARAVYDAIAAYLP